jgi:asparagine synthase (glutamine-hydrolysing)
MADLLAIISPDPREVVEQAAMDDFVGAYAALRGEAAHREDVGEGSCRVAVLSHLSIPVVGVERDGERWAAWAGPRAAGSALGSLAGLGGQFALVRREGDGEVLVASDPLGLKPFFVATAGGLTYASTSALVLAKALRLKPSRAGAEAFLRVGQQFGRLTPWEGLRRMMPAEALRIGAGGVREETYWQPTVAPEVRRLDFDATAAACVERGVGATEGLLRDGCWLDLTGGFDSRLLALFADRAPEAFETNTVGPSDSEDVRIAERVAAAAGWPWVRFGLPDDWTERLAATVDSAVAWGDCHLDALALAEVAQGHREKPPTSELLLNGGGGEHLRAYPWGHELWRANRSTEVSFERLISWRVFSPLDLSLFRRDPSPTVAADMRAELEARVAPFAGTPNTFQGDLLYAFKSTGHFGAFQAAAGADVRVELPFYERGLFDTAISVDPRHRGRHRLMRSMIGRLDPAIAALPTETGGPAEPVRLTNLPSFAPYFWRRGARFGGRLRGRLYGSGGEETPSPSILARAALVGHLRAEGRLDPTRMRSAALFDPERLEDALSRAPEAPLSVDWGALGRIVTLELALEAVDAAFD